MQLFTPLILGDLQALDHIHGLLEVKWVKAGSIRENLWALKSISRRKHVDMTPITSFWAVWKEKNVRILKGQTLIMDSI